MKNSQKKNQNILGKGEGSIPFFCIIGNRQNKIAKIAAVLFCALFLLQSNSYALENSAFKYKSNPVLTDFAKGPSAGNVTLKIGGVVLNLVVSQFVLPEILSGGPDAITKEAVRNSIMKDQIIGLAAEIGADTAVFNGADPAQTQRWAGLAAGLVSGFTKIASAPIDISNNAAVWALAKEAVKWEAPAAVSSWVEIDKHNPGAGMVISPVVGILANTSMEKLAKSISDVRFTADGKPLSQSQVDTLIKGNQALEKLQDAIKSGKIKAQEIVNFETGPIKDAYVAVLDSQEVVKNYGDFAYGQNNIAIADQNILSGAWQTISNVSPGQIVAPIVSTGVATMLYKYYNFQEGIPQDKAAVRAISSFAGSVIGGSINQTKRSSDAVLSKAQKLDPKTGARFDVVSRDWRKPDYSFGESVARNAIIQGVNYGLDLVNIKAKGVDGATDTGYVANNLIDGTTKFAVANLVSSGIDTVFLTNEDVLQKYNGMIKDDGELIGKTNTPTQVLSAPNYGEILVANLKDGLKDVALNFIPLSGPSYGPNAAYESIGFVNDVMARYVHNMDSLLAPAYSLGGSMARTGGDKFSASVGNALFSRDKMVYTKVNLTNEVRNSLNLKNYSLGLGLKDPAAQPIGFGAGQVALVMIDQEREIENINKGSRADDMTHRLSVRELGRPEAFIFDLKYSTVTDNMQIRPAKKDDDIRRTVQNNALNKVQIADNSLIDYGNLRKLIADTPENPAKKNRLGFENPLDEKIVRKEIEKTIKLVQESRAQQEAELDAWMQEGRARRKATLEERIREEYVYRQQQEFGNLIVRGGDEGNKDKISYTAKTPYLSAITCIDQFGRSVFSIAFNNINQDKLASGLGFYVRNNDNPGDKEKTAYIGSDFEHDIVGPLNEGSLFIPSQAARMTKFYSVAGGNTTLTDTIQILKTPNVDEGRKLVFTFYNEGGRPARYLEYNGVIGGQDGVNLDLVNISTNSILIDKNVKTKLLLTPEKITGIPEFARKKLSLIPREYLNKAIQFLKDRFGKEYSKALKDNAAVIKNNIESYRPTDNLGRFESVEFGEFTYDFAVNKVGRLPTQIFMVAYRKLPGGALDSSLKESPRGNLWAISTNTFKYDNKELKGLKLLGDKSLNLTGADNYSAEYDYNTILHSSNPELSPIMLNDSSLRRVFVSDIFPQLNK